MRAIPPWAWQTLAIVGAIAAAALYLGARIDALAPPDMGAPMPEAGAPMSDDVPVASDQQLEDARGERHTQ